MFEQDDQRKNSIDQNHQIEQNHTYSIMFPRTDGFSHEETLDLLKLKFDSQLHSNSLLNNCYRSHKTHMVEFFNQFRELNCPQLAEPEVSEFYSNECFINLYDLGRFIQGKTQKCPALMIGSLPKDFKTLLDNMFAEQGYIPNFQKFLFFYPTYLQKHCSLERELFEGNGIDNKIAYFLGIIACAQLGSIYGMNRMLNRFCRVGGDLEWVTKKKYPQKIKRILKLNRKLARSIWEINSDDIEEILQAKIWNLNQMAFIIQILCFSHSLSTISLAIGLKCQEISFTSINFSKLIEIKNEYDSLNFESGEGQKLASVIQNLGRNSSNSDEQIQKIEKKKQMLEKLQAEKTGNNRKFLKKSLRKSDNEQMIENYMREIGNQLTKQQLYFKLHQVVKPLLQDYHQIQKRTDKDFPPSDASDTNFNTAFPLLYNLTSNTAELILDLINYSQIMTNNNFGHKIIDGTKSFRKAIRYYSENLCGYFHSDYNYKNISSCLTMPLKFYIRLLTLSPVNINNQVLRQIKHQQGQLNLFDLGHVAILTANCKMGLSLTCSIHAFQS